MYEKLLIMAIITLYENYIGVKAILVILVTIIYGI
jgi:hypothetical protein